MREALDIWVKGIVQGVGFRPFVYRLAKRYLITGWVLNGVDGVHIHAEGESNLLDEFVMEISENAPAAAQVSEIEMKEVPLEPYDTFEIRFSDDAPAEETTLVSPDLATCADCERELFDEGDRRFHYPFINCTNCGPRFTIIDALPYDRAQTSMRDFEMCDECQHEYDDPADRRFHAQPNACFACGPVISLGVKCENAMRECVSDDCANGDCVNSENTKGACANETEFIISEGRDRESSDAIFEKATQMLCDGKILAVKGLGGFHLVCDANNPEAIETLRQRKHRDGKPLAVMMRTIDEVRHVCDVNDEEAALLEGAARPIVLLRKRIGAQFASGLADKLPELGVMLPYTPVQHLLLAAFGETLSKAPINAAAASSDTDSETALNPPMLVMTSGNLHDEPIVTSNAEAYDKLGCIADAILTNDRAIVSRFDDSVVRVISAGESGQAVQFIRRARGYAPLPIRFGNAAVESEHTGEAANDDAGTAPESYTVFGTGAEQKNTFTFLRGAEAFVSQHIGDMENAETFDAWIEAKGRYERLFDLKADRIACDLHPEYLTTKWAHEHAALATPPIPIKQTQHHHAHIVSVMAENNLSDAICGIAFDGTGFGTDGNIWGGEALLSNTSDFERLMNFAYVPMPGGAAAIKNPLRMAYGVLWEYDLLEHPGASSALEELGHDQAQMCESMIEQGLNTPVTSSVGRLFDAASALLGVCTAPTYEGEPAILLEAALWEGFASEMYDRQSAYSIDVVKNTATETSTAHDTSVLLFDAEPAFRALLDDKLAGVSVSVIARRFHDAFVGAILQAAQVADALYGIRTVALTGGVFMNRYIMENALSGLEAAGFTAAINRELPPNDGCISFGQSVIALSCPAEAEGAGGD